MIIFSWWYLCFNLPHNSLRYPHILCLTMFLGLILQATVEDCPNLIIINNIIVFIILVLIIIFKMSLLLDLYANFLSFPFFNFNNLDKRSCAETKFKIPLNVSSQFY